MRTCVSRGFERESCAVVATVVLFAGAQFVCAQGALAQSVAAHHETAYSFETVDPPFGTPGVDMTVECLFLSDSGVVTSQYQMPPDPNFYVNWHSAARLFGEWINIDVPEAFITGVTAVNSRGQVALDYQLLPDGPWHAAFSDWRGLHPLPDLPDYPGGIIVNNLDDFGRVAAAVIDAAGAWHGFVGDVANHTILDYPGAITTIAMDLNDHRKVVGYYNLPDGSLHSFWYKGGEFATIDPPGSSAALATAINNAGVIVGAYGTAEGESPGFVLTHGRYATLRVPNAVYTMPYFINDRGQISGTYGDANWVNHGFVATPVHGE